MENVDFLLQQLALVEEDLDRGESQNNQRQNSYRGQREEEKVAKIEDEVIACKHITDFAKGSWRLNYYQSKFHIEEDDLEDFLNKISKAYLEGINWVYCYYYTGCPSWDWYYPFHYAPLAVDLVKKYKTEYNFKLGEPYRPVEQLMSVLPKQSSHALPK